MTFRQLTKAQQRFLTDTVAAGGVGFPCVEDYKPMLMLRTLGLVTYEKGKFFHGKAIPTQAGVELCTAKARR